jgi:hypothetical protein
MLKQVLDSLEGLPEAVQALYKKGADNRFYLDVEEDPDHKKKIDEFRENNIKLMKEKGELEKKIAAFGTDPAEVKKMQKRLQEIEDQKLVDAGQVDKLVDQKVERMKADFEGQIKQMTEALNQKDQSLAKTTEQLSNVLIDSQITQAVTAIGAVRKGAMQDILSRGRLTWKLDENGKPVPMHDGRVLYGKDGKSVMTFEEWSKALADSASYLFEPTSGGGGGGGGKGGNDGKQKIEGDLSKLPASERLRLAHEAEAAKQKV